MKKVFLKLSIMFGIANIICILIFGGLVLLEFVNKSIKIQIAEAQRLIRYHES